MALLVVIPKGLRSFTTTGVEVVVDRRLGDRRTGKGLDHGLRGTGTDPRTRRPAFDVKAFVIRSRGE